MSGTMTISALHLTGGLPMFDAFMHYIIQHHRIFPDLAEIHYHWYCPGDIYDLEAVLATIENFPRPLIPPRRARCLVITVDNSVSEGVEWVRTRAEMSWTIFSWA